ILACPLPFRMRRAARISQTRETQTSILAVLHCAFNGDAVHFPINAFFPPAEAHSRESSKSSWPKTRAYIRLGIECPVPNPTAREMALAALRNRRPTSIFTRRLCLVSPGGKCPVSQILATPARPLCEPSHRPPKKGPPEVALFLLR